MSIQEWAGKNIGTRTVEYDEKDAILYALSLGALETDLDLVFEDQLRVLPTFGLTLAQWAPDVLGAEGVFDHLSVHGSQSLTVHKPMPASGSFEMTARVGDVWDKNPAAVVDVVVECDYFSATWSIFCPGRGGFSGDRGPKSVRNPRTGEPEEIVFSTFRTQAALYRLTGDRHHIHIDPAASTLIGQPKPILQGLCTLSAAVLPLARAQAKHPADLSSIRGRFTGPVIPGDELTIYRWPADEFEVYRRGQVVISDGMVTFS